MDLDPILSALSKLEQSINDRYTDLNDKYQQNMLKDKLYDVLKSIYEEKYSGSNKIVLYYRTLIRSPDSSQAKVLKVSFNVLESIGSRNDTKTCSRAE